MSIRDHYLRVTEQWTIRRYVGAIMLVALALRLFIWFALRNYWPWNEGFVHDEWNLHAMNFVRYGDVTNDMGEAMLIRPPGFVLFLAGLFKLVGENYPVWSLTLVAFDVVTAGLICALGWHVWGKPAGLAAGLFYALSLPVVFYCCQIEQFITAVPFVFVWVCGCALLARSQHRSWGWVAGLGLVAGWLVLNKSVYSTFPLLFGVTMLFVRDNAPVGRVIRNVVCIALVAAVVVSPWMCRNYKVSGGRLIPSQLLLWTNFMVDVYWDELDASTGGEHDSGTLNQEANQRLERLPEVAAIRNTTDLPLAHEEVQIEDFSRAQSLLWIREHPVGFIRKTAKNAWQFWIGAENRKKTLMFAALQAIPLGLALLGLIMVFRGGNWRPMAFPLTAVFALWAPYSAIYSMGRFSLVLVPILGIILGYGLALWAAHRGRRLL